MKKVAQVTLRELLTIGGKTYTTIDVRRPCVGDEEDAMDQALAMGKGENRVTLELCLYSKITLIPYDVLRAMDADDYRAIRDAAVELTRPMETPLEEARQENQPEQQNG